MSNAVASIFLFSRLFVVQSFGIMYGIIHVVKIRGFAFLHRTISFATGAAIAGIGFFYLNDQIRFSVRFT